MDDFINSYESISFDGQFIDAKGNNILSTRKTTSNSKILYFSSDNGNTIQTIEGPIARNTICCLSIDGKIMYIYSAIFQTFYKSSDGGQSWNQHMSSTGGGTWLQCSDSGQYYMWCQNGFRMRISQDYGETFSTVELKSMQGDISSTGEYMCSAHKLNSDLYINISNDYGSNWKETILNIGGSSTNNVSVSVSKSGQYILVSASGSNLRVSSDYGVSFQEVPNTNQQWKNCDISYSNPQYMYAQIDSQTNTIWQSQDYGQSFSAVYDSPQGISYLNLVSTDTYLFAYNRNTRRIDRYTFTEEDEEPEETTPVDETFNLGEEDEEPEETTPVDETFDLAEEEEETEDTFNLAGEEETEDDDAFDLSADTAEERLIALLGEKMYHPGYRTYAQKMVQDSLSQPKPLQAGRCSRQRPNQCNKIDGGARLNVLKQVLYLEEEGQITKEQANLFIQNLALPDENDLAENRLMTLLQQKMYHPGYRTYAKKMVQGSLSGSKPLQGGQCSRRRPNRCNKITSGARRNVLKQVLHLEEEGQITEEQADLFIQNLALPENL